MGMTHGQREIRRRAASRRRTRRIKRAGIVLVIGMCVALLPTPQFDFVEAAFGVRVPFPEHRVASAAELDDAHAAIREHEIRQHEEEFVVTDDDHSNNESNGHTHDDEHDHVLLASKRVIGAAEAAQDFTIIGLTYEEEPTEPAVVRVQTTDGEWGPWHPLVLNVDEGPDPHTDEFNGYATEPLYTGHAVAYEVSVPVEDVDQVDVALVENHTQRVTTTPAADASTDIHSSRNFDVKTRASWGARSASVGSAAAARFGVVHHTAGTNGYSQAQVPGIIRGVQAYHMDANGWSDIGYNFLVDRFGTIWEGRVNSLDVATIGAHAVGFNTGSVGVSILGDFTSVQASEAARTAAARIISWVLWRDNQPTTGSVTVTSGGSSRYPAGQSVTLPRIVGHRDVGHTTCPGTIHAHLGTMRSQIGVFAKAYGLGSRPIGGVSITADEDLISVKGWTFDRDAYLQPVTVHIHFNSRTRAVLANEWNSPVGSRYPKAGKYTGFSASYTNLPKGATNVCVTALNLGPRNQDTLLRCETVVVK